jgi:hypothetical protein
MKVNKKFGDKIYVEWIDAYNTSGWESYKDACQVSEEVHCRTNAFFVHETKDFLIVAGTVGKSIKNDIMGKLLIPKFWIRKVK